jgi:hypothetical protein
MRHSVRIPHRSMGRPRAVTSLLISLLFGLACARATSAPSTVEPVQQADPPVYHVGESWTMVYGRDDEEPTHVFQLTVIAVTPGTIKISNTSRGRTAREEDYDSMGRLTRNGDVAYEPSLDSVRFPMSVGMSWQGNYQIVSDESTKAVTAEVSVDGAEIIHVQAGDFFAFRLISHGVIASIQKSKFKDQQSFERTYWYAPSVKRVVKSETKTYAIAAKQTGQKTETVELVNYLPAPSGEASDASTAEGQ